MSLTYLDLFSGAGGWACGLEMAGLKHAGSYDINKSACRTAGANLGRAVFCVDLRKFIDTLDGKYPQPDLIVGSPPCQGFSNEGYKRKEDPRNSLVWTYLDIVEKLAPKVWIFENVPGFQRLYNGSYYEEFTQRLNSMSYYWHTFLLDASQSGVPQKRIRFLRSPLKIFSQKNLNPPIPSTEKSTAPQKQFLCGKRSRIYPKWELGKKWVFLIMINCRNVAINLGLEKEVTN